MHRLLCAICCIIVKLVVVEVCAACGSSTGVASALDVGYRHMYNLQFEDAHTVFDAWEQAHPGDPMGPVSNAAAYLFAELDRLHLLEAELFVDDDHFFTRTRAVPDPALKRAFDGALAAALAQTDRLLARMPGDGNALLAKIFALGLRADYKALLHKQYLSSLADMKASRVLAEQLVAVRPHCYDAYLAIGVENYMLSLKPALVRWLLRLSGAQTDQTTGVALLRLTAASGHYLQPYARLLLAVAALRAGDRGQARELLAGLALEFPQNRLYATELARLQ